MFAETKVIQFPGFGVMRFFPVLCVSLFFAGSAGAYSVHGTSCKATADSFSRLANGMTYEQVRAIIGCDGAVMSESDIAGFRTFMIAWDGSGSLGANMNIMIQNGRMVMKSQFGLR